MATDNHRQTAVLFPDPQEHFDHPRWQTVAELDAPNIEASQQQLDKASDDGPLQHVDPSTPHPAAAASDRYNEDPFVDDDDAVAAGFSPALGDELDAPLPVSYREDDYAIDTVPVPRWVSAHVPADKLVMGEPNRRFRRRRTATPAPTPDIDAPSQATPRPGQQKRPIPFGWIAGGVLAAASLIGAAVVVTGTDQTPATPVAAAPEPSQAPPASTADSTAAPTTPVAAPWCTTAATADATTTDDAGNRESAIGVIAAFEHAYYVQRSGAAVAALMTSPAPADRIQAVIDRTPAGTEHCVTIAATDIPDVHAVALSLRTPSGSESAIASRITTARAGESYAIANVEEVR
ncbi:hypothetical protein CH253_17705 [Rhodococcus sp. 06-156-3C]|uniref:hypothetical protein n=1 Tax=Nocardiaceae TaxID=85025 RepID=UPI000690BE32|nr:MULTISPECIES: hypothetical protein [Rhodococcus]OZD18300.1 hypothetical protein CH280_07030 [Rhodococcus sp. 06-156-4C]OZD18898.1 hypothetical protein CH253_17705 [Rhodococcus sp. 06-156-3C]OZD22408.1 hypothetical protein CH248_09290 [Rhodococcus sp. 06-156-4a]OZD33992.1 hypothetical protein CH247_07820 [Rhodococcus sp. 06-156-3b]OZD38729.1 hypothetical protein CH284_06240 [Rhodococcus sp. 06-156-3]